MKEEVLKELLETIKDTKSFVLEQAPDVAQEMILIARVESFIIFIVIIISIYGFLFSKKKVKELKPNTDASLAYTFSTIAFPGVFIITFMKLVSYLPCWIAPKYFLLKELSKLI